MVQLSQLHWLELILWKFSCCTERTMANISLKIFRKSTAWSTYSNPPLLPAPPWTPGTYLYQSWERLHGSGLPVYLGYWSSRGISFLTQGTTQNTGNVKWPKQRPLPAFLQTHFWSWKSFKNTGYSLDMIQNAKYIVGSWFWVRIQDSVYATAWI